MENSTSKINREIDYRLSFGTGGLYVSESKVLLQLYSDLNSWSSVIEKSVDQNILQFNSDASTKRATREICIRLQTLSPEEISFYLGADIHDQSIISWIAVCRTYKFIGDFTLKVIIESFASYRLDIKHADFDFFFEEQSQWYPELEEIKETTRKKLRQILFRMMREAGLLTSSGGLRPLTPSPVLNNLGSITKQDLIRFIPGVSL